MGIELSDLSEKVPVRHILLVGQNLTIRERAHQRKVERAAHDDKIAIKKVIKRIQSRVDLCSFLGFTSTMPIMIMTTTGMTPSSNESRIRVRYRDNDES